MKTQLLAYLILSLVLSGAFGLTELAATTCRSPESALPRLPAYGIELSVDWEPERLTKVQVNSGSLLTLVLRPAENVVGPVEARGFLSRGRGWQPWAVHLDRADSGAFALRARLRDLPVLVPGHWKTAFLVGRPASLPVDPAAVPTGAPHPDWLLLEGEIDVVE